MRLLSGLIDVRKVWYSMMPDPDGVADVRPRSDPISSLRREPLVHFVVLAGMLFLLHALFAPREREAILVTAPMVDELVARHEEIVGRPLEPAERAAVIQDYVDQEALVREARRLGFDNDSRTRQHLAMKMRFFLDEDRPQATPEQLRDLYESNPDRYAIPARRAVQIVTLPDGAPPAPTLEALASAEPDTLGLRQRTLPRHSAYDVRMAYDAAFADAVFDIEDEAWHGPLTSLRGVHLVRILERFPSSQPTFEEVEEYLRQEWDFTERRRIVDEKTAEILDRYEVIVETGDE